MSLPASHKRTIKFGNENLMALLAFIKKGELLASPLLLLGYLFFSSCFSADFS